MTGANSESKLAYQITALVLLCILLMSAIKNAFACWQIRMQLTSPIIPQSTVSAMSLPFLYAAVAILPLIIVALLLYRSNRFTVSFIISAIGLVGQFMYLQLA
jgi:hypothetical protein